MRVRPWAIGLFIVVGFAIFTAILFQIGSRQKLFNRHLTLYTEFANLGGLTNGAKVRVSGLDAGQIKKIEIPKDPSQKFKLELQVEEKIHGIVRKDSVASIETEGVVGDKFVLIKKGSESSPEVHAGAMLPSKEPLDLSALLEKSSGLLTDVHGSINDIRGRVDGALDSITRTVNHADTLVTHVRPDISGIARNGNQISAKLNTLVTDLNAGKGPAGLILKDQASREQLQSTLANVQQASVNLNQVSLRADETVADFQARQLIAKTQATIENVQSLSQQLDTTMQQALAKDNIGQDGATNLRQTLSSLNRTSTNLAEDTEALKHNFFLRGFFKRRGFYNLDQLSRKEYVKACEHHDHDADDRKWLPAQDLVIDNGNGKEELSEVGRQLINAELDPIVDTLPSRIIVVEGYADGGSANDQYALSRQRADLVRKYLEAHYHLKHSNLGVVALRDQPPKGSGKERWNGAGIMLWNEK